MDDTLKRLGAVESAVLQIGGDVREIKAILPSLATKAELAELRSEVREIRSVLPHFASKSISMPWRARSGRTSRHSGPTCMPWRRGTSAG